MKMTLRFSAKKNIIHDEIVFSFDIIYNDKELFEWMNLSYSSATKCRFY